MSQRELAEALDVSLGKTNYCLKALLERGLIKIQNFRNSQNKAAYAYYLTPEGISKKTLLTAGFLKRKLAEYEIQLHYPVRCAETCSTSLLLPSPVVISRLCFTVPAMPMRFLHPILKPTGASISRVRTIW